MNLQLTLLWDFRVIRWFFSAAQAKIFPCLKHYLFGFFNCLFEADVSQRLEMCVQEPQIANTPLKLKLPACFVVPINRINYNSTASKTKSWLSNHPIVVITTHTGQYPWIHTDQYLLSMFTRPPCRALSHTPASLHINQTQHCKLLPGMVSSQAQLCRSNLELMQTIIQAAREVKKTCQKTFSDMRWNCSSIDIPADSPKYRPDLDRGMFIKSSEWQHGQRFLSLSPSFFTHKSLMFIVTLDV